MIRYILVLLLYVHACLSWHIYDLSKDVSGCLSSETIANESKTAPLSEEDIQRWSLWPGLMNHFDKMHGRSVFGLRDAIDIIWKHQHPIDCKAAKFVVFEGYDGGFGCEPYMVGGMMGLAFLMNRVFVLAPNRDHYKNFGWWTNNSFCRLQGVHSLNCYYEQFTSCTDKDIYGEEEGYNRGKFIAESEGLPIDQKKYLSISEIYYNNTWVLPQKTIVLSQVGVDVGRLFIPDAFIHILKCSPIPENFHFYWWRAISATYFMRPNKATRHLMQVKYREQVQLNHHHNDHHKDSCVSVYVRRGDKYVEMYMVPLLMYQDALELIGNSTEDVAHLPSKENEKNKEIKKSNNNLYFGSEDHDELQAMKSWSSTHGWTMHYSNFFDRRTVSAGIRDYNMQMEQMHQKQYKYDEMQYFAMIYDLDKHLKCEAFVCTMESNYCRLMNELRATVGGKANRPYVDLYCNTHVTNENYKNNCTSSIDKPMHLDW